MHDSSKVFAQGIRFEHAAQIMELQINFQFDLFNRKLIPKETLEFALGLMVTQIVNRAFALELFFKSLLGRPIRCHDLKDLFHELPDIDREGINLRFDEIVKSSTMLKVIAAHHNASFAMADVLNEINDVFVTWRYVYESVGKIDNSLGNPVAMKELSRAVQDYILAKNPQWRDGLNMFTNMQDHGQIYPPKN